MKFDVVANAPMGRERVFPVHSLVTVILVSFQSRLFLMMTVSISGLLLAQRIMW